MPFTHHKQSFDTAFKNVSGLSNVHFNARSLNGNCENIENFLKTTNREFDVIAISETWQNDSSVNSVKLNNFLSDYLSFSVSRTNQRGGGVSIYVKNNHVCNLNPNLSFCYENLLECVTVELTNNKNEKNLISCVYRKPGTDISEFNTCIENKFSSVVNKKMYLCGDFNIDLLKYEDHELTRTFVDTLFSLGLFPLITKPTRITDISETLIDNIFTNQLDIEHQSGLL